LLGELGTVSGQGPEVKAFREMAHDLKDLTARIDTLLEHSTRRDVQWFVKAASTLLK
jgi:hypothetical protein